MNNDIQKKGTDFEVAKAEHALEWRWLDEQGRAMTKWKQGDPPPMLEISDSKGTMRVEFRDVPDEGEV